MDQPTMQIIDPPTPEFGYPFFSTMQVTDPPPEFGEPFISSFVTHAGEMLDTVVNQVPLQPQPVDGIDQIIGWEGDSEDIMMFLLQQDYQETPINSIYEVGLGGPVNTSTTPTAVFPLNTFSAENVAFNNAYGGGSHEAPPENVEIGDAESSSANKKKRTAENHKLSGRKRRGRINELMKILQSHVPNLVMHSDKATMLELVIDHISRLEEINRIRTAFPSDVQHHLELLADRLGVVVFIEVLNIGLAYMGIGPLMGDNRPSTPAMPHANPASNPMQSMFMNTGAMNTSGYTGAPELYAPYPQARGHRPC